MSEFSRHKKIDMHSHLGTWGSPFNYQIDAAGVVKIMNDYNIEKTVICAASSDKNHEIVKAYKEFPDRLIPVARIDCSKGQKAYDLFEKLITEENFKGGKIQSLVDGYAADSPVVDPVAEICEKYKLPFYMHSGHEPYALPWQIGLLAERHPKLKVVMIHMGHGHGVYVNAAITMAKKYDNIWLETSGTSMSAQIGNAYKSVGSDRVMFGLDTPFHAPSVEIQKILTSGVGDEGIENIFYNNAKKFLNL